MKEYAFDMEMFAVVKVVAEDEESAKAAAIEVFEGCSPTPEYIAGYNSRSIETTVTEAEILVEASLPDLFAVDGVELK